MGNIAKAVSSGVVLMASTMLVACGESADPFSATVSQPATTKEEPSIRPNSKTDRPECRASESITLGPSNNWNPAVSVASEWHQPTIELLATARFHLVGVIARSENIFGFYYDNDDNEDYTGRIVESGEMIRLTTTTFTVTPDYMKPLDSFDDVTLCVVRYA